MAIPNEQGTIDSLYREMTKAKGEIRKDSRMIKVVTTIGLLGGALLIYSGVNENPIHATEMIVGMGLWGMALVLRYRALRQNSKVEEMIERERKKLAWLELHNSPIGFRVINDDPDRSLRRLVKLEHVAHMARRPDDVRMN